MDQLGWRVILGLAGGLTGLFAVFVAVLFLSRGAAVGSASEVADLREPPAGANAAGADPAELRPTVTVRASDYGPILFDDRGYALYAFTRDARGRSACAEACTESWPPYLLRGSVRVGTGLEASLLATTRRPNGDRQVTRESLQITRRPTPGLEPGTPSLRVMGCKPDARRSRRPS
jgi:predicted lipoprotein with Yx(FWY)xxD motif